MPMYYAVIKPDEDSYLVTFPDLENCFTQGDHLTHAVVMAEDVLGLMLTDYEDRGNIPAPTKANDVLLPDGASLVLIEVDTGNFRETV